MLCAPLCAALIAGIARRTGIDSAVAAVCDRRVFSKTYRRLSIVARRSQTAATVAPPAAIFQPRIIVAAPGGAYLAAGVSGVKSMPRKAMLVLPACARVVTSAFSPMSTIRTTRLEFTEPP